MPGQSNGQPDPVTTATTEKELDTESAQKEPDAQREGSKSTSATGGEAPDTQRGNGTLPEAPAGVAGTQIASVSHDRPLIQSSGQAGGMELVSDLKSSATIVDKNPAGHDGETVKNQAKVVYDRRKYVPSKKAMVDPLKMDMSKPAGIPLTCEYLTCSYAIYKLRDQM